MIICPSKQTIKVLQNIILLREAYNWDYQFVKLIVHCLKYKTMLIYYYVTANEVDIGGFFGMWRLFSPNIGLTCYIVHSQIEINNITNPKGKVSSLTLFRRSAQPGLNWGLVGSCMSSLMSRDKPSQSHTDVFSLQKLI